MWATSAADNLVFTGTSGTPDHGTAKVASSDTWVFGASTATGRPFASGARPPASRRHRSCISVYVHRSAPSMTPIRSPWAVAARSRNDKGLSGSNENRISANDSTRCVISSASSVRDGGCDLGCEGAQAFIRDLEWHSRQRGPRHHLVERIDTVNR